MGLPPFATRQSSGKITENDGNNTSRCSDEGVVRAPSETTHAAKHRIIEAQTAMSTEVHRSHVLQGGGGGGDKWQDSHRRS